MNQALLRQKIILQLGDLLLSNIEMGHALEVKTNEVAALQDKLDDLTPKDSLPPSPKSSEG